MKNLLKEMHCAHENHEMESLTVSIAEKLKGKKIQTLYFGYNGQDGADEFIVGDIVSEYDLAKLDTTAEGFANRAEYWESYMSGDQLQEKKNILTLLRSDNSSTFIKAYTFEGDFWCSDSDRYVFFRLAENE